MKKATKSVLYYIAVLAGLILVLVVARRIYRKHKLASRIVQSKESYDTKTVEHVQHIEAFVENVIQKQPLKNMSTPKLLRAAKVAHFGVPGKWMSDGRFIEGIKPNPEYAVPAYAELLKRKQYSILEDYSRLMEYGVPQSDQIVNKSLALQLYQLMFNRTTDIYKKFDLFFLGRLQQQVQELMQIWMPLFMAQRWVNFCCLPGWAEQLVLHLGWTKSS